MATVEPSSKRDESIDKDKMSLSPSGNSLQKLQQLLNETKVKHTEELYFVNLELTTTQKAKEAVEDQMAELFRDMEELQESLSHNADASSKVQIEKYERMLRIMNNQIALVRDSSDSIIKSLKSEISDLMDDKVKSELTLMNKLSDLDREKGKLEKMLTMDEKNKTKPACDDRSAASSVNRGEKTKPPQPPRRCKSIVDEDDGAIRILCVPGSDPMSLFIFPQLLDEGEDRGHIVFCCSTNDKAGNAGFIFHCSSRLLIDLLYEAPARRVLF